MKAANSEPRRMLNGRTVLIPVVWVAYAVTLVLLYRLLGPVVLPLAAAPVVATGWCLSFSIAFWDRWCFRSPRRRWLRRGGAWGNAGGR